MKTLPQFFLLLALALTGCAPAPQLGSRLVAPTENQSGFARAEAMQPLEFPRDFGPHPDYQTEWWYYTGNLDTADGRHFGYQFTVFRRALLPPAERTERASGWAADQIYFAHFALSDIGAGEFTAAERFGRGAAGLAGAQAEPYAVWLEDWRVEETAPGVVRLTAVHESIALDLTLTDLKGPILQGDRGYSRKGAEPGNASYYYSQTRLESAGTVTVNGEAFPVSGLSWKDHEYSTSALSEGQVGWDWFALQLDDGTDLMLYTMRRADGTVDGFSHGTLILADGTTRPLAWGEYSITPTGEWTSPHSGAVYPSGWQIEIPEYGVSLTLMPWQNDQELRLSFVYWEGAVRIEGTHAGAAVTGNGYVELTGYFASMEGEF
ncbi:MAG: hypothetical protein EPO32_05385 [Anaerolineae bacterium]|nr:MAG: hypothetical protein EPO32_05385 [Anaerolineae bacterium]